MGLIKLNCSGHVIEGQHLKIVSLFLGNFVGLTKGNGYENSLYNGYSAYGVFIKDTFCT